MRVINIDTDSAEREELEIGIEGENGYSEYRFHFDKWLEEFPGATVSAVYWRPDGQSIIIEPGTQTSPIVWKPSRTELKYHGRGLVQLRITNGDMLGKRPPVPVYILSAPKESDSETEDERNPIG